MIEFGFFFVFLIFFGIGFMVVHKKLEEILKVLVDTKNLLSKE
jgi:hypothetical protein